jgi:hypothetical protein
MSLRRLPPLTPLLAALLALAPFSAPAAAVDAADCSSTAVGAALRTAADGDTVRVPAGACAGWNVTIPDGKRIVLRGAGPASTSVSGGVLRLGSAGARLTGFALSDVQISVDGDDWRIDHNRIAGSRPFFDLLVFGGRECTHPRGVIDHNELRNIRVSVVGWNGLLAHCLWSRPLALGDPQQVFVEDNTYVGTQWASAVDGSYGGRYVFRHNTVTDMYVEAHSVQGGNRAIRSWEIYNNTLRQSAIPMWAPFFLRGGTGVVHGNTIDGTWSVPGIVLDNVRSFDDRGAPWFRCDGTRQADGNRLPNGWPCRDQIGRSTDTGLSTTADMKPQAAQPAHFWNNTAPGGRSPAVVVHNRTEAWIVAGRDYVAGAPWPGYTPYPYPHPLTREGRP